MGPGSKEPDPRGFDSRGSIDAIRIATKGQSQGQGGGMRYTVFDAPILNTMLSKLSRFGLKQFGWRLIGERPPDPKFVVIAAPHTSNWDLLVMLSVAFAFKVKLYWMGKHTLFRWPLGALLKRLGGVPIDRSSSHDVVSQSIEMFNRHS